MIDPVWFGGAVAVAGASVVGWVLGQSRGRAGIAKAQLENAALAQRREAAERAARDAQTETQRWRKLSLATSGLSREPVYLARTSPIDAEELANLARGLVLVDDVVVTETSGLPLTREADGGSVTLASAAGAAATLIQRSAALGVAVAQISLETFTAEHLCVRPLLGRAAGAVLVARTTSQPMNPLAVDAVVHAAARDALDLPSTSPVFAVRGTTETKLIAAPWSDVADVLVTEVQGDVTGLLVTSDGTPAVSVVKDGPSAAVRAGVAWELAAFARRTGILLRDAPVSRVELVLQDRTRVTWAALGPRSSFALLAFGRSDPRFMARLSGRVLRAMSARERSAA